MMRHAWKNNRLSVFEWKILGTTVGYFVGWPGRYGCGSTRNIRQGLYFATREAAKDFRDSIESARKISIDNMETIEKID